MARVVAAVLARVQEHHLGRGERVAGRARLGDQQAVGLQARPVDPRGAAQQPPAQLRRHRDGIAGRVPAARRHHSSGGINVRGHTLAEARPASVIHRPRPPPSRLSVIT